jgi:hypothetical protein
LGYSDFVENEEVGLAVDKIRGTMFASYGLDDEAARSCKKQRNDRSQ